MSFTSARTCRTISPAISTSQGKPLLLTSLLTAIVLLSSGLQVVAQDFRVRTTVSHQNPENSRWESLARSLTIFHAGKVYDQVEAVGEVVIFDPLQSRFVILSLTGNELATEVPFEEVHQFLKVARVETVKYMDELRLRGKPDARRAMQSLSFQLKPMFDEGYDPTSGQLRLSSEFVTYTVQTATVEKPLIVQQYLQWADWTARMNYILHPQAVGPDVRIALNTALRERDRIPTQVDLKLSLDGDTHLRAEHTFEPKLGPYDRDSITKWERLRTADGVRWVDFREYQRILVTAAGKSSASR